MARLDKQLARLAEREARLNAELETHPHDYERLADLGVRLQALADEREALELEWLAAADLLE